MSLASLKKNRASTFEKLNEQLTKMSTTGFSDPTADSYWRITKDSVGNGAATIRFLPAPEGEDLPFVRIWDHGFKGPSGTWYIENSLTTIGQDDPVSKYNSKLWNSGNENDKKQAQLQKRRLHYIANILVIRDQANPAAEGKVFRFKFGKKIFEKLNDMMNPQFDDDPKVNVFDLWDGANFKFRVRKYEGYDNYDKSEFEPQSELFDGDMEKLETIYEQLYSLQECIAADKFKSYDELEAKLFRVLGLSTEGGSHVTKRAADNAPASIDEGQRSSDLDMSKLGARETTAKSAPESDEAELQWFKNLVNN